MLKKLLAEGIGTFGLIFCGTGAIVINEVTNGSVSHVGIAMTFGLIVIAMIYAFGEASGAHINPAVSLGFALTDLFSVRLLAPYILAQMVGALLASFVLKMLFPENLHLGATLPAGSDWQSFVLEVILTYFLMLVILMVSQGSSAVQPFTGLAVGFTVMLEALFAGPICGASMNPARSLAPALVSGDWTSLWVYLTAPFLGAILATFTWKIFKKPNHL